MQKPRTPEQDPTRAVLIDEYVELTAELSAFQPATKLSCGQITGIEAAGRHLDKLKTAIKLPYESLEADQSFVESGILHQVQISARRNERSYKPGALKKLATLLKTVFWSHCTLPMKVLDEHVMEPGKYTETGQTGYRTLKAIPAAVAKVETAEKLPKAA